MATISTQIASHIATLANLPLTEDEIATFAPQLGSVLEYTSHAASLPTEGVEETSQVTGLENVTREDIVEPDRMFTQEEALQNAKNTYKGFFVVPAVINE